MRRNLPEISGTPNLKSSPCAAESAGAAPQKSWWSLHRSEPLKGTPRQCRAYRGTQLRGLWQPPELREACKTFRNPFGIAGWLIMSPGFQPCREEPSYREKR